MSFPDLDVVVPVGMSLALAALSIALCALLLNRHAAYLAVVAAERNFRELYNNIGEGVFRSTLDGHMMSANPALVHLNGYENEAEMLDDVSDIGGQWYVDPNRRAEIHRMLLEKGKVSNIVSEVHRYKTRERIWVEESTRLVRDEKTGQPRYYDGTVREVTETVRRLQLQERYEKITSIVSGCLYQMLMTPDGKATIPYASIGLKEIYGVSPEEVARDASILSKLVHPDDFPALMDSFKRAMRTMTPRQDEYRIRSTDGVEKWILGHAVPEAQSDGTTLWHGYFVDISKQKRSEAEIYSLAYLDTLTGLPNRPALVEALQSALDARDEKRWSALLFIDLDQFKVLNDTKGHHFGDQLLCGVAARLKPIMGGNDVVARLGGDEFVILLQGVGLSSVIAEEQVKRVVERVHAAIADPFVIEGFSFQTTASIGVALFRADGIALDEILKRADMAMYEAKAAGRGGVSFFAAEMQTVLEERLALTMELRDALEGGELTLHYQPQVDDAGACFGVEALLRWNHPTRGEITPGVFVPLAESAGFGGQIDAFVLATACTTLRRWQQKPKMRHLQMSVNTSGEKVGQALVALVTNALHATGAEPGRLMIELTEHVMLDNVAEVDAALAALKAIGVKIALDDFGTGYSSLSHLKRLPIDALKIDCSFVSDIETDQNDRVIAQTILNIARNLGVSAIAEGVENEMQALILRRFGCHAYQGFMYGRPMSLEDLERHLAAGERPRVVVSPPSLQVV